MVVVVRTGCREGPRVRLIVIAALGLDEWISCLAGKGADLDSDSTVIDS